LIEYLGKKYGPQVAERAVHPDGHLNQAGRKVGIDFNPNRLIIPTMSPHRVVEWCKKEQPEKVDSLMESLFKAYFEEGKTIHLSEQLLECIDKAGLSAYSDKIITMLGTDEYKGEITSTDRFAKNQLRASGVPFFIIEKEDVDESPIAFSGAQPSEVIQDAISKILQS